MEVYQVIMVDEYDNFYEMGWYRKLEDSLDSVNNFLSIYNCKLKKEDLKVYPSTFGACFDIMLGEMFEDNEDVQGIQLRGFIHNVYESLDELLEGN